MSVTLLTPPATEPVSLEQAKAWLRVDTPDEDELIAGLIVAARGVIEQQARKCLLAQSWRITLDHWPDDGVIRLPLAPVMAVDAIRVKTSATGETLLASTGYRLDAARGLVLITAAPPLPAVMIGGIEIDVTCGYGATATDVPGPLRLAMRLMIARWYEHRGDGAGPEQTLPEELAPLMASFRAPRL